MDDTPPSEMRAKRGTLTEPGQNSPDRYRSVAENLDLFRRMRAGEFPNGARVLRATDALFLETLPATVAVVGADYVAVELAVALRKLGSGVTLLGAGSRLLPEIDAALTTNSREGFETQLAEAIEQTARDLSGLSDDARAWGTVRVQRIACRLRSTLRRTQAKLDENARVLEILLPPEDRWSLVPKGLVAYTLADAFTAESESRLAKLTPRNAAT